MGTLEKPGVPRALLYQMVIEKLAEGVLVVDLDTKAIEDANPAIAKMLGYTLDELTSLSIYDVVAHGPSEVDRTIQLTIDLGQHLLPRRRYRHKDGHIVLVEAMVNRLDVSGQRIAFVIVRDLAERISLESRLRNLKLYDSTTGLPTSAHLRDHAVHAIDIAGKKDELLAFLTFDLNRFSCVNQRYGLNVGDQVIAYIGHCLNDQFKDCEMVARLDGGDEFGILCVATDGLASVKSIAERVLQLVDEPIKLENGQKIPLSITVGAAVFPEHGETFDELAHHAGTAMRKARIDRVPYRLYSTSQEPFGNFGFDVAEELTRAIHEDSLSLVYQPIVRLAAAKCVGAEVLLRWPHQRFGLVPPSYFIPVAEDLQIIHKVDKWVIRKAVQQLALWQEQFPGLWLSVNVSAMTLAVDGLTQWLKIVLNENKVPPHLLMLEVTETAAMVDRASIIAILEGLRGLGIRIGLDDFGTGYSSLAYLKHIPFDLVKIDREFISGIGADARDEQTVKTIVGLLQNVHCEIVAEGVETREQVEWLKAVGVGMAQGYWFARPKPADTALQSFITCSISTLNEEQVQLDLGEAYSAGSER